jgi:MFS family permease
MQRHMSLKAAGFAVAIPFGVAMIGGLIGGWMGDWLVRCGLSPVDSRKYPMTVSLLLVAVFTLWAAFITSNTAAIVLISISMFLNQIASTNVWSMASVAGPKKYTASFAGISNCGGYIGAALAPTIPLPPRLSGCRSGRHRPRADRAHSDAGGHCHDHAASGTAAIGSRHCGANPTGLPAALPPRE